MIFHVHLAAAVAVVAVVAVVAYLLGRLNEVEAQATERHRLRNELAAARLLLDHHGIPWPGSDRPAE